MEDIPKDLVINWDQTFMKIVPSLSWTMEKRGTKRIEIAAADDKLLLRLHVQLLVNFYPFN